MNTQQIIRMANKYMKKSIITYEQEKLKLSGNVISSNCCGIT